MQFNSFSTENIKGQHWKRNPLLIKQRLLKFLEAFFPNSHGVFPLETFHIHLGTFLCNLLQVTLPWKEVGLDDLQRFFPTLKILLFCNYLHDLLSYHCQPSTDPGVPKYTRKSKLESLIVTVGEEKWDIVQYHSIFDLVCGENMGLKISKPDKANQDNNIFHC